MNKCKEYYCLTAGNNSTNIYIYKIAKGGNLSDLIDVYVQAASTEDALGMIINNKEKMCKGVFEGPEQYLHITGVKKVDGFKDLSLDIITECSMPLEESEIFNFGGIEIEDKEGLIYNLDFHSAHTMSTPSECFITTECSKFNNDYPQWIAFVANKAYENIAKFREIYTCVGENPELNCKITDAKFNVTTSDENNEKKQCEYPVSEAAIKEANLSYYC